MNNKIEIYERVKLIRVEKKLSREEVASKLDLSVTAYGRIERGGTELSMSRLEQLAEIFGVEKDELLGISSDKNTDDLLAEIEKLNKKIEDLQSIIRWVFHQGIEENPLTLPLHKEYVAKIKKMDLDIRVYRDTRLFTGEEKKHISDYIIDRAMQIEEVSKLIKSNIFTVEDWTKAVNSYVYRTD